MAARDRARVLRRAADLIRERADELVALESHDVGKPVTLCRAVDVETAAQQYEYCASLAEGLDGATRSTPIPALAYTLREPVGVVAAITPFNFPLILSSTKIAAALAAGNVVVHKPADDTPLSALFMAQLLSDAGVPDGVLNVVTGSGQVVGEALLRHPGVDKIAFTGSTAVGRHAASVAGEHLKPVTMELGGNAAHIVFDDADLDVAIGAVIKAFVFNSGQFCMAGPRLLVARPLHDTVVGILEQAVPTVPIGNPRDEATVIGPMAGERQLRKVEEYVELARKEGGRIVCGGEPLELDGGFYYKPTVIADLPDDSRVIAEEVFGPVLTVQPFDTEDEAVALANGTPYGLAAGLQTRDVARAHRVAARLDAGIVWVNDWAMLDPAVPFGGVKDSGFGREYGPEALEAYTRVKSVVISLPLVPSRGAAMTITTQAAVVESGGAPFTLVEVELDEPRADEVLVRMTAAGLCHTDLGVASGGLPFPLPGVLGHEGAGVVERVGAAVTSVVPGDHVLLSFTSCGGCGNCRGGHPAYCATWLPDNLIGGARRDGSATITRGGEPLGGHFFGQSSFARLAVADERSVVKVDPSAPLETIAPLGCGVQTGVGAVWNVLRPGPGSTVVVAGAGAVGLSAVMAAALTPALQIVAVDVVPSRLDLARKLGATHVVDASTEDLPARIAEITGGAGCRRRHRDHRQRAGAAPVRRQPRRPRHRRRRRRPAVRHRGRARRQRDARRQDRHRHHPRRQRDPDLHPGCSPRWSPTAGCPSASWSRPTTSPTSSRPSPT